MVSIIFTDLGFPSGTFAGNVEDLKDAFTDNLGGELDDTKLILGQIGGSEPLSDIGPWLDGRTWKAWNGSNYTPAVINIGAAGDYIGLTANPTSNRTQTLQDKEGTVALLSDIRDGRASVNLGLTSNVIDWSTSDNFFHSYSADQVYTIANSLPGQEIAIAFSSTGAHTPTFPDYVLWPGGTPPAAQSGVTIILLENVAGTIYGEIVGNGYA